MKKLVFLSVIVLIITGCQMTEQKQVAITIDDVPNIRKYRAESEIAFLNYLSDNQLPAAIFINEGLLFNDTSVDTNSHYLKRWIDDDHITIGNHTYSHPNYSIIGLEAFTNEIVKGMKVSAEIAAESGKTIDYFRFPYNDLGNDSLQQTAIKLVLDSLRLISTPFTVESSDWMFNAIYEYYLDTDSLDKAKEIGQAYIAATLRHFDWMDSVTVAQYGRPIKHIYLCHDNSINVDYLPQIIDALKAADYKFISLDDAMSDEVYQQNSHYYNSYGISWVYRWMGDEQERGQLMRQAPDVNDYFEMYKRITSETDY
ncbi:polysaccharide deacetylase family protein [Carboxylicivirga sp. A043]|uniref:polysaccharide deacetylase family protein n=1 Tax=Carboxylicivirga litoralis TaxID=2816963 RepID=UPI0021CAE37B|nr:polysaccharide deacetylase family protein [Carboxylicivirga sp. A043]MCU4157351.1 polysaccharide deacetylase family protein [Carboxylicivirga sp. A043]